MSATTPDLQAEFERNNQSQDYDAGDTKRSSEKNYNEGDTKRSSEKTKKAEFLKDIPGIERFLSSRRYERYEEIFNVDLNIDLNTPIDAPLRRPDGSAVNGTKNALFLAIDNLMDLELCELLLEYGANPNVSNNDGGLANTTVLMSAMHSAPRRIIELLIQHGADITARDSNNCTAFDYGILRHCPSCPSPNPELMPENDYRSICDPAHRIPVDTEQQISNGTFAFHNFTRMQQLQPLMARWVELYYPPFMNRLQDALSNFFSSNKSYFPGLSDIIVSYTVDVNSGFYVSKFLEDNPALSREIAGDLYTLFVDAYNTYKRGEKLSIEQGDLKKSSEVQTQSQALSTAHPSGNPGSEPKEKPGYYLSWNPRTWISCCRRNRSNPSLASFPKPFKPPY